MAARITREQAIAELKRRGIYKEPPENNSKGWAGIGNDITDSLESAPGALGDMIASIPGGIEKSGRYALTHNPVSTFGNLGAGGVESLAGLLSAPQKLARYLSEQFPDSGKGNEKFMKFSEKLPFFIPKSGGASNHDKDSTFYESLMNFEKQHGLAAQSPDEESVRNAGGLLFGGKALSKLPSMLARTSAVTAEQGGRGGDPIHAALLGMVGEGAAKAPWKKLPEATVNVAKNIPEAIKSIPETAGKTAAAGLESIADLGTKAHIPGLQPTLGALGSYLKYISVKPEKLAQRKLFSDIAPEDLPKINERMEAAKRLGLEYLTPAEATLSPFEAAKQGHIGRTSSGSKLLFEKGKQRTSSEGKAINNFLDTIYDEKELNPQKKSAYDETMKSSVPEDFVERYKNKPVISEAIKKLESNSSYRQLIEDELGVKLGEVSPTSFRYWDIVKRVLGDMEENAKDSKGRPTTDSSVKTSTRKQMVAEMDKIQPEYKVARSISERRFTRQKMEDIFDKKKMTGNNFYKFIESKRNFDNTLQKLNAFPEAQQKLRDMQLLFGDLIPNDPSIRTAAAMKRTSMWDSRNKLDALKQDLDERYGKKHDVATVNLMTDPNWLNLLSEYLKNHKGSK